MSLGRPNIKQENISINNIDALIIQLAQLGKQGRDGNNADDNCGHLVRFLIESFKKLLNRESVQASLIPTSNSRDSARSEGFFEERTVKFENDNNKEYETTTYIAIQPFRSSRGMSAKGLEGIVPPGVDTEIDLENNTSRTTVYLHSVRNLEESFYLDTLNENLKAKARIKNGVIYGSLTLNVWPLDRPDGVDHVIFFCATADQVYFIDLSLYNGITRVGTPLFHSLRQAEAPSGERAYYFNDEEEIVLNAHISLPLCTYQSLIHFMVHGCLVFTAPVVANTTTTTSSVMTALQRQTESVGLANNNNATQVAIKTEPGLDAISKKRALPDSEHVSSVGQITRELGQVSLSDQPSLSEIQPQIDEGEGWSWQKYKDEITKSPNMFENRKEKNKRENSYVIYGLLEVDDILNIPEVKKRVRIDVGAKGECVKLIPTHVKTIVIGRASKEAVAAIPARYTMVEAGSTATTSNAFSGLSQYVDTLIFKVRANVPFRLEFTAFSLIPLTLKKLICVDLTNEQLQKINEQLPAHVKLYSRIEGIETELSRVIVETNNKETPKKKRKKNHLALRNSDVVVTTTTSNVEAAIVPPRSQSQPPAFVVGSTITTTSTRKQNENVNILPRQATTVVPPPSLFSGVTGFLFQPNVNTIAGFLGGIEEKASEFHKNNRDGGVKEDATFIKFGST